MVEKKSGIKKALSILAGLGFAALLASPYIFFKNEIKELAALGYIGLFLSCLISNLSILLPSSSTIIVVVAASTLNPWLCVLIGGLGTAFGEQASYLCGFVGSAGFQQEKSAGHKKVINWFSKRPMLTVFMFALVPLPVFDIVGIVAGTNRMKWWKYALAAALGKILKFTIVVLGIYYVFPFLIEKIPGGLGDLLNNYLNKITTSI